MLDRYSVENNSPTVPKLSPNILQIRIPHVIDGENEEVVILFDTLSDVGVQTAGLFFVGFFGGFGFVDDPRALRSGHFGIWCCRIRGRPPGWELCTIALRVGRLDR